MKIYTKDTTNFNNNGLGFLTDVINCYVIDEINGNYQLNMEYAINGHLSEYLVEENIIKCKVADTTEQLFRIKVVEKNFKTIQITAQHIFYDLLDNFLEDTYPKNLNGQQFLTHILNNTNFATSFTAYSNISDIKSARYVRRNPVMAIMGDIDNSMINLFGGELKRDNFTINFLIKVGNDNGVKLSFGKNITGIDLTIDINEMATRVMPQGYDGLLLPEKYVDSSLINNYPTPKVLKINFDDVVYDPESTEAGVYTNLQDAYDALREKVRELYSLGLDKPKININIDWIELSKTNEYKNYANLEKVNIGDTITSNIFGTDYETRVISTTYDVIKDMIINFQIGTFKASLTNSINVLNQEIKKIDPSSILTQAQVNATNLITTAMGGYIYKTQSELYIMNTDDPTTATKVWRWNINGLGYSNNGINGPYEIAMTMDGSIVANFITTGQLNTSVIQGYGTLTTQVQDNTNAIGDRTGKTSSITQDIASLEAQIGDIADITTSASANDGSIDSSELQNIAASYPIRIEIKPNNDNISYLYPNSSLFPSNSLYSKTRKLRFTNTDTNEVFDYILPDDLLYYDENNYDSFVADYEANQCQIIKKCKYNADGSVGLLSTPTTNTYSFADEIEAAFSLTEGNYSVELLGYNTGYLFVRLMVLNAYTAQYATKVELNSSIRQTAEEINLEVSKKVDSDEIISTINQSAEQIQIQAAKVNLTGYITATDLSGSGTTTINGSNITTGTIDASQVSVSNINANNITSGTINGNNVAVSNINASNITTGTLNGSNVSITNINASNIKTGTLNGNDVSITNLNASNITSGTISANKIDGGTITASAFNLGNGNFTSTASGTIYAKSGKVGGWNLSSSYLGGSSGGYEVRLTPQYLEAKAPGDTWEYLRWYDLVEQVSDISVKKEIKKLDNKYGKFYDDLIPVSFKYKNKYEPRSNESIHFGFIAQDIEKSILDNNLGNLSVLHGEKLLKIDKNEIIALNTWQIQNLKAQVKEQQETIKDLIKRIEKLEREKDEK